MRVILYCSLVLFAVLLFPASSKARDINLSGTEGPVVRALLDRQIATDNECRGGSGDDPETFKYCDERELLSAELKSKGWCYGEPGQAGYQMVWHKCGTKQTVTQTELKQDPRKNKKTECDDSGLCKRLEAGGKKYQAVRNEISGEQLYQAYMANEVAADMDFKHKYFTVKGQISEIKKDIMNNVILSMPAGAGLFSQLQLKLFGRQIKGLTPDGGTFVSSSVEEFASKMAVGQTINAQCRGAGMVMKTPILNDCLIIPK